MKRFLVGLILVVTVFVFGNACVLAESKNIFTSNNVVDEGKIDGEKQNIVNIYLFHSKTCSHCKQELKLLSKLKKKFKNIRVYTYEISEKDNKKLFESVCSEFKISESGVPFTVIGDKYFMGYNDDISIKKFTKAISYYSIYDYNDRVKGVINNDELIFDNEFNNEIMVNEYINKYDNYKILFLNVKDLDLSTNNILLTILSELNLFNMIILIMLSFVIYKIKNNKQRLLCVILYVLVYLFPNIFNYTSNGNIDVIKVMFLIILNCFVYSILIYIVKNKKRYIIYNIVMLMGVISNYLKLIYYNKYIDLFYKINNLYSIDMFSYVFEIIIGIIVIFVFVVVVIYILINVIKMIFVFKKKLFK